MIPLDITMYDTLSLRGTTILAKSVRKKVEFYKRTISSTEAMMVAMHHPI